MCCFLPLAAQAEEGDAREENIREDGTWARDHKFQEKRKTVERKAGEPIPNGIMRSWLALRLSDPALFEKGVRMNASERELMMMVVQMHLACKAKADKEERVIKTFKEACLSRMSEARTDSR